jgi:glutathione synthase/RimK-type ligase-like ATP-grasp enzyme
MKAFLHFDSIPSSASWHNQFYLNLKKYVDVIKVDMNDENALNYLKKNYKKGDIFFARIKHPAPSEKPPYLLHKIKPLYHEINELFKSKCFPSLKSIDLFDDKLKQYNFFKKNNYSIPNTYFLNNKSDLEKTNINFPIVCKKINGASSKNVWLAKSAEDISVPCIVQSFHYNKEDIRINVIGNRIMGYVRENRENDFRASGSGNLKYPDELPIECVKFAYKISKENNLMQSMAYDFIKSELGHWMVLEMSYTYFDNYIKNCNYYYDSNQNFKKINKSKSIYPQKYIVEDFFNKINIKLI